MKVMPRNPENTILKKPDEDLSAFCASGCHWKVQHLQLSTHVILRVVTFSPPKPMFPLSVVMVPGLVSVMLTFQKILLGLTRYFVVHYVETREKSSSVVPPHSSFDVTTIGRDIAEVVTRLKLRRNRYVLFGASLGATAIVDGYRFLPQEPFCLVLLEPNAVFDYPGWSLKIIRFGAPLYAILRPVAKWYLKKFRVNTREDYEMFRITSRALDAADPYKLRDTILAIAPYQIWERLARIKVPTLVVAASRDKFHRHEDIVRIVEEIPDCTYLDLEVHERTHSEAFSEHVINFVKHVYRSNRGH